MPRTAPKIPDILHEGIESADDGSVRMVTAMVYQACIEKDYGWLTDDKPGGGRYWMRLAGLDYEGIMERLHGCKR